MKNRDDVKTAGKKMLGAIAVKAKSKLGKNATVVQRSSWMVKTSDAGRRSKEFERSVLDSLAISMMYQIEMRDNFPEKEKLTSLIVEAGFDISEIEYGLIFTLVMSWLRLKNPLEMNSEEMEGLLEEFAAAVIDKKIVTRTRCVIDRINMVPDNILLDKGVCIRKIFDEELWEFGAMGSIYSPYLHHFGIGTALLSDNWVILDISEEHKIKEQSYTWVLKAAVLIDMVMVSRGSFTVVDLGTKKNMWFGGMTMGPSEKIQNVIGRFVGKPYVFDEEVAIKMKKEWADIRNVLKSGNNLKLPAERLLEGLSRTDIKDAVIDYSIGLEALLTKGAAQEMSYRFALRGANIIGWDGGDKREVYQKLKSFYEMRNKIVHGTSVKDKDVLNAYEIGEQALRDILRWYLNKGIVDVEKGTKHVEDRILT